MMIKTIVVATVSLALAATATVARAADHGDSEFAFRELASQAKHDANGNVTREDFLNYMGATFDRLDSDKKGVIKVVAAKNTLACGVARGWRYQPGSSTAGC